MEEVTQEDFNQLRAERNNSIVIEQVERILDKKILQWKEDLRSSLDEIKGLIEPIVEERGSKENSSEEGVVDVFEASRILKVTCKTIRRYYTEKTIPGFKSANGRIFFRREDFERFLKGEL